MGIYVRARRSYLLSYNSHALKDTFNIHALDLAAVARSFGFTTPPRVNINIESRAAHTRKAIKGGTGAGADYRRQKTGHGFSAQNPYGKRAEGDRRQFVRV